MKVIFLPSYHEMGGASTNVRVNLFLTFLESSRDGFATSEALGSLGNPNRLYVTFVHETESRYGKIENLQFRQSTFENVSTLCRGSGFGSSPAANAYCSC
jgi:hypothetical protein